MLKLAKGASHFSLLESNEVKTFEDFVLLVAENIFVQAVGRPVTDSLIRNFDILDPKLKERGSGQLPRFQRLLEDSFGDLSTSIMQIILEEVCTLLKIPAETFKNRDFANMLEYLSRSYHHDVI